MLANKFKGEAPLKLSDGREYILVLDFDAMAAAESIYGKPLQRLMAEATMGFIGAARALLAGMLQRHHPDLSMDEVAEILISHRDAVDAAMQAATASAMPDAEGEKSGNASKAGKRSGAGGAKSASPRKTSGSKRSAPSR